MEAEAEERVELEGEIVLRLGFELGESPANLTVR